MLTGGVIGDLVMGKSFGYSNVAAMAIDFEAQMMGYKGVIRFNDGTAYEYKTIQDFSKVRCMFAAMSSKETRRINRWL